jgi:phosphonate degradation associated HDIG domain protein
MSPEHVVDWIFSLFHARGDRHYGEDVTELQHALQCATLARRDGRDGALVAACLLHDVGHLVHELPEDFTQKGLDDRHENLGANVLAPHFPAEVVEPIRLHVPAKRYLCWKDPAYFDGLSEVSRASLALQGGPMTDAEGVEFEANPHHEAAVRLRHYDDQGKDPSIATLGLDDFRELLVGLAFVTPEHADRAGRS